MTPIFLDLVREVSRLRLLRHCRSVKIVAAGIDDIEKTGFFGDRIAQVRLWGPAGGILLRTYFTMPVATKWAASGMGRSISSIDSDLAADFMREYANIFGGYLRTILEEVRIQFNMTAPVLRPNRGDDLKAELASNGPSIRTWKLHCGNDSIICSAMFDIVDESRFATAKGEFERLTLKICDEALRLDKIIGVVKPMV